MKIIISPAKKMLVNLDDFDVLSQPRYLDKTRQILNVMQQLSYEEAKALWHTSDKLTAPNYAQLQSTNLADRLTPAILSYSGIQYQYMAPDILTTDGLTYLQQNLRILSGFYGILNPFDGIVPYRLEMQAHLAVNHTSNLYQFWGRHLYDALEVATDEPIINLASKEYSKAITPFLKKDDYFIDVIFGHLVAGKIKIRATRAKMARGEMVRFLAENQVTDVDDLKHFDSPHYQFDASRSTKQHLVFLTNDDNY